MKITLSNGTSAYIGVRHLSSPDGKRRRTQIWFLHPSYDEIVVEAKCYVKDNFCKRTGRKVAAQYLLNKLSFLLNKEDRRLVFQRICPEYSRNK